MDAPRRAEGTPAVDLDQLQQIGIHHRSVEQVLEVQNNTAPNRHRLFVAEGLWACNTVLGADVEIDTFFYCPEAAYSDEARKRAEELAARAYRAYRISPRTLAKIAERDRPDGLACLARMPSWDPAALRFGRSALVLVTDGIEIPGNLGTLIRTLDACRADLLIMTNRRTRMTHPKVFRGSQGTSVVVPHIEFDQVEDAIAWLRSRSFEVYLADTDDSANYRTVDFRGRTALVVGSERYGITKPWYEAGFRRVGVPMLGTGDSLNVAVSASVLLYEARARKEGW